MKAHAIHSLAKRMKETKAAFVRNLEALARYRADVKAGLKPPPKRDRTKVTRRLDLTLDGSFGKERNKRLNITVHQDGRIVLWSERSPREEIVMADDVYRFAIRCRVNRGLLEKARAAKAKRAERLAAQRLARAEKRLFRKDE